MDISPATPTAAAAPKAPDPDRATRAAARAFEASFLSEMLRESGVNAASPAFGGGAGEEAFSSFLTEQYAAKLAERGGIGLSEAIFEALRARGAGA
ncbi:rod-binding protein [Amaricoccus solimangrovi]|uniref:Flagellar biosynthesis protein FlgJ n=1 Tax=Amaricoccus solimangrovi TaxID=2589815 RepID=A0A501X0T8_9RHOB|nr:rod-binding protein [Amaricoccus solimangrovi]TPE53581.1 flagellar biosynthesis protein FlgJ [Amaricoccus solimangrovi]